MADQHNPTDQLEVRRRKLRFRSWHRGMREADLILGPFADAALPALTTAEIDRYEELLAFPDTILLPWLTGEHPVANAALAPIVRRIRDCRPPDPH
jgi:antitoxin CptB